MRKLWVGEAIICFRDLDDVSRSRIAGFIAIFTLRDFSLTGFASWDIENITEDYYSSLHKFFNNGHPEFGDYQISSDGRLNYTRNLSFCLGYTVLLVYCAWFHFIWRHFTVRIEEFQIELSILDRLIISHMQYARWKCGCFYLSEGRRPYSRV